MLSLGIVWNTAQQYNEEIINDIKKQVKIIDCIQLKLDGEFKSFVNDIYYNEEKWKIEKKYHSMESCENKEVTLIIFQFDHSKKNYHVQKHKDVYTELNNLKVCIRNKYSKQINNYIFDNLFHCTDDEFEFYNNYKTALNYINKIPKQEKNIKEVKQYVKRKDR